MKQFYVYILSSPSEVLYIGMTNGLERRIAEHKQKLIPGFTAKYNVTRLVFFEAFPTATEAIATERKIKGWTRAKKLDLIRRHNPANRDLAEDFAETWSISGGDPSLRSG